MSRLFGTDGMRGEAGKFPLDAQTIKIAGWSLARHLQEGAERAPRLIIGRDTRESGEWIEQAFIAGATEAGAQCDSAGIITTPGVAYLTKRLNADAGVVISASHNPYHDNGIKIFSPSGRKLDEKIERQIEADIAAKNGAETSVDAPGKAALSSIDSHRLREYYLEYLAEEIVPGLHLDGIRMAIDCANGAAYELAPALFSRLGASQVMALNNKPDGRNINLNCGSLHLEGLSQTVLEGNYDFGVAYDGDADRALFVNHLGEIVDGDATLWAMTRHLAQQGQLKSRSIVATVMSNIGLERALRTIDVQLLRTDVGDKYVLEELLRSGAQLGGEQSGHLIFPQLSLAGDGMVTTLYLLQAMRESGQTLSGLTEGFVRYPQVLVNVRVRDKKPFMDVPTIAARKEQIEKQLGANGRLLLRYSGTEPLARVMVEGEDKTEIENLAAELAAEIKAALV